MADEKILTNAQEDESSTLGLTYIYIELDGKPKFELDKLNSVFKVNGVDLLAKVRKYT